MHRSLVLLLLVLVYVDAAQARALGRSFGELILTDGTVLRDVRLMSYSEHHRGVAIAVDRSLRTVPLARFPADVQSQILADYSSDRVRIVPNVVTTTVRPSAALTPAAAPRREIAGPQESTIDLLRKQAVIEAPDELRFHLQKTNTRVSSVDCKIRSVEKVDGWQQIRVMGTASFSIWNHHDRDYNWRTGKFEVLFDIVNGESLKASTVTFDGIARRVDDN